MKLISFVLVLACVQVQAFELYQITPTVGAGNSILDLQIKNQYNEVKYTPSNTTYVFAGLALNGFSGQIKGSTKEEKKDNIDRGDTKLTDFQLSFRLTDFFTTDLFYQRYQSYFAETSKIYGVLPDLSLAHTGFQFMFQQNKDYDFGMVRESIWSQSTDGGSWLYSVGIDHFEMTGDPTPPALLTSLKSGLKKMNAYSLTARAMYGYNWLWEHWFTGVAGGFGASLNQITADYPTQNMSTVNASFPFSIGVAAGYRWNENSTGLFVRSFSWALNFDDKELLSSSTTAGLYLTMPFGQQRQETKVKK